MIYLYVRIPERDRGPIAFAYQNSWPHLRRVIWAPLSSNPAIRTPAL